VNIDYEANRGVLAVEPVGALDKGDFEMLAAQIDSLKRRGLELNGLLIRSRKFPGYERVSDTLAHAQFVMEHGKDVGKVALCTDTPFAPVLAAFGRTFAGASVKRFPFDGRDEAEQWLVY